MFEVYADVLFLNNVTGNILVLLSAGILMRRKIKKIRLLFASVIGALYSTILFFTSLKALPVLFLNILFVLFVIKISFAAKSHIEYIKNALYFFVSNFLIGGCIYVFYSLTGISKITALSNGIAYFNIPLPFSLILLISSVLLVMAVSKLNSEVKLNSLYMNVSVHIGDMSIPLQGFFDTGNMLTDFLTGLPVLIAEAESFKPFFPKETYEKIISGKVESMTGEELKNLRLIPANTAFSNSSLLVCIKPDYITLKDKTKAKKAEALIGLTGRKLSLTGEYNMLLSSMIGV